MVVIPFVARDLIRRDTQPLGQLLLRQPQRNPSPHEPTPDLSQTEKRPRSPRRICSYASTSSLRWAVNESAG